VDGRPITYAAPHRAIEKIGGVMMEQFIKPVQFCSTPGFRFPITRPAAGA
jgi:hypothetical protein